MGATGSQALVHLLSWFPKDPTTKKKNFFEIIIMGHFIFLSRDDCSCFCRNELILACPVYEGRRRKRQNPVLFPGAKDIGRASHGV